MIDFHTHILPEIDDGSSSMEETINLIKEAKEAGFTDIISTSHYIKYRYESTASEKKKLLKSVEQTLKEENVEIKLHLGNEIYYSHSILELLKSKVVCPIKNTKYILFEFPLNHEPRSMYNVIYELLEDGFVPILAHPERYNFIQQVPNLVGELIDKGVLMQSNFASIIGFYGHKPKIIVKKLLENNMVHFLGSDVHRQNTIYPRIPEILTEIENIIGKEGIEQLTEKNPELVLKNGTIEPEDPQIIKLSLKEKMLIKI